MAFSRYARNSISVDGKGLNASNSVSIIRAALTQGTLPISRTLTTTQADRLDSIAGAVYGDGRYWWVLAAASNIGWGMQVPPGISIVVPDLKAVERLIG
jgi:phage tail protein X